MSAGFAGALREHVLLQRRTNAADGLGAALPATVPLGSTWAAIEPLAPGPSVTGDPANGADRFRVTLRDRDIRPGDILIAAAASGPMTVTAVSRDPAQRDRVVTLAEKRW